MIRTNTSRKTMTTSRNQAETQARVWAACEEINGAVRSTVRSLKITDEDRGRFIFSRDAYGGRVSLHLLGRPIVAARATYSNN